MSSLEEVQVWLGQSVDTSSICSGYSELKTLPFLTSLGCAIRRPSLLKTHLNADLRKKLGLSGLLMVDSGGFALSMNPAAPWSLQQVGDAIANIDADIFVTLDLPPHFADSAQDRQHKIRTSVENYERLLERFPEKIIMPVVHGRTQDEVQRCIDLIASVQPMPKWVGIGGVVPLLLGRRLLSDWPGTPESFIATSLRSTRFKFPRSKIHVFGAGGTRTFPAMVALGADSGDSIGWRHAAGFGSVFFPLKSQRSIDDRKPKGAARKVLDEDDSIDLMRCGCPICKTRKTLRGRIGSLQKGFHNRSIHNAWVLANQYAQWPSTRAELRNLIVGGKLGAKWASAISDHFKVNRLQSAASGLSSSFSAERFAQISSS